MVGQFLIHQMNFIFPPYANERVPGCLFVLKLCFSFCFIFWVCSGLIAWPNHLQHRNTHYSTKKTSQYSSRLRKQDEQIILFACFSALFVLVMCNNAM